MGEGGVVLCSLGIALGVQSIDQSVLIKLKQNVIYIIKGEDNYY